METNMQPQEIQKDKPPQSLSGFLGDIKDLIEGIGACWVRGEVIELSIKKNYTQLELAEYEEVNGEKKLIARAGGYISWRNSPKILDKFVKGAGCDLAKGQEVLVKVKPLFKPEFGFSLEIVDIDPSFTVGKLVQQVEFIRKKLQELNEWHKQKQLSLPKFIQNIALIAPSSAAGLDDFSHSMDRLSSVLEYTQYHATFSGASMEDSFTKAFTQIFNQHKLTPFDAVVIVRGGGDSGSLQQLNRFKMVRMVCRLPIPVLTGIGHEKDVTLLDEVAHMAFGTPSKVAAYFIEDKLNVIREYERLLVNINQVVERQVTLGLSETENLYQFSSRRAFEMFSGAAAQVKDHYHDVTQSSGNYVFNRSRDIEETLNGIKTNAVKITNIKKQECDALQFTVEVDGKELVNSVERKFNVAKSDVDRSSLSIIQNYQSKVALKAQESIQLANSLTDKTYSKMQHFCDKLSNQFSHQISITAQNTNNTMGQIYSYQTSVVERYETGLAAIYQSIQAYDVGPTLGRGFNIAWQDGAVIKHSTQLSDGELSLQFVDKTIALNINLDKTESSNGKYTTV
jgi:exodeoxyribonuclease VII large subunit